MEMSKNKSTRRLVQAALFAAIVFAATLIHVHIPGMLTGYVNLGDCMVLVSGVLLGPLYGGLAAGLGSAMADFLHGYMIYVPGTFCIKLLVALTASLLYRVFSGKSREYKPLPIVISGILAETVMVVGYFLYEGAVIPGINYAAALLGVPGNCMQAVLGVTVSVLVLRVMKRIDIVGLMNKK